MLPVYVVLCNVTTLQHTMGLIGIVMACYGQKSKFADVLKFLIIKCLVSVPVLACLPLYRNDARPGCLMIYIYYIAR